MATATITTQAAPDRETIILAMLEAAEAGDEESYDKLSAMLSTAEQKATTPNEQ